MNCILVETVGPEDGPKWRMVYQFYPVGGIETVALVSARIDGRGMTPVILEQEVNPPPPALWPMSHFFEQWDADGWGGLTVNIRSELVNHRFNEMTYKREVIEGMSVLDLANLCLEVWIKSMQESIEIRRAEVLARWVRLENNTEQKGY